MTGILNMNGNRITNLSLPTDNSDAVSKGYVDLRTNRITGFTHSVTITSTRNSFPLIVVAPNGVSPNQILVIVSPHNMLFEFRRNMADSGSHAETKVYYRFVFPPVTGNLVVTVSGLICLLNSPIIEASETRNVITLGL